MIRNFNKYANNECSHCNGLRFIKTKTLDSYSLQAERCTHCMTPSENYSSALQLVHDTKEALRVAKIELTKYKDNHYADMSYRYVEFFKGVK